MTYTLEIKLDVLPNIVSNGSHGHWTTHARNKKRLIELTRMAIGFKKPEKPLEKAKCTFIRVSAREPDGDNMIISFKPIRDALVHAGVVVDDKPKNMPDPVYRWEQGRRNEGHVIIRVEEIA